MTGSTPSRTRRRRTDARRILRRLTGDDAPLRREIAIASEHLRIAEEIHAARTEAGLSLAQLARLARTPTHAVARIEVADFTRQSIAVLTRVAGALGLRLEIRCVEVRRKTGGA